MDEYRNRKPMLFGFVSAILSDWFLALTVLLTAGGGVGLWFLNERSFRGHGIYGMALLVLGILDCLAAASCDWLVDTINHVINMRSNVMGLFFFPVCNMLLSLGMAIALLGAGVIVLSTWAKIRMKRRNRRKSIASEP